MFVYMSFFLAIVHVWIYMVLWMCFDLVGKCLYSCMVRFVSVCFLISGCVSLILWVFVCVSVCGFVFVFLYLALLRLCLFLWISLCLFKLFVSYCELVYVLSFYCAILHIWVPESVPNVCNGMLVCLYTLSYFLPV